ncbi:Methyltransferase type 11 [Desulfofarcimen acetoxidans DSM 771]|uniref:Methyltransferase type 11 n=1 Tax=Desulfofarcimen acetoxidans (strain ATCC 49208 / DSM 771 / KCTC 5769 / VKM B-1644 / 5575) TaxID=485916 RepID=C8W5V8_DESAS|nr:class I SAM-dependent methyltransferase [Desulfofarcimen acetoxidans]ACV61413.1 Methyltransferase type 11 [Desulfofarcimen acetoxidans DSM 771]
MDISTIRELWKPNLRNPKAGIEWWNSKADKFSVKEIPTAENSIGMRIIQRENMVCKGSRTLDVGCGGGRFSFVFEAMGAEATATDFSPEMIRKAMENGKDRGSNVCFSADNWHTVDLKEKSWEKQFDLVLANMTPAVVSADTFLKLIKASRGWVLMVKPTRRTNLILDELNKLVNAEPDTKALDETMAYAFDLAWCTGGRPKLEYEEQIWKNDHLLEEAIKEYTLRISSTHELSDSDSEKIREYLESTAVDGIVHENSSTTIAAMYWHVN